MLEITDGNVNLLVGPEQQAAFQRNLEGLTAKEGVACVLLIDTAGKIIAGAGGLGRLELATVAALAAGDFATTRALARAVGEKDFSLVFQRERELNVYLRAVGDESLLVVIFDQVQGLGSVRVLVRQAQADLRKTLDECPRAVVGPDALQHTVDLEPAPVLDATTPEEAPAPVRAAPPPPPSRLVRNPPADLIRKFWRIKTLAEDCVKAGVPASAPEAWRDARDRVTRVAGMISTGNAEESRTLLAEVEGILMTAYGVVVAERAAEDADRPVLAIWHRLAELSEAPFAEAFGPRSPGILGNVDRDSGERHPDILGRAEAGRIPEDGLQAVVGWPRDRRRQAIGRAFLDLLLNRLWVTDKIFGRGEGDALIARWRADVAGRPDKSLPPGMQQALEALLGHADRRAAARRNPGER
jgi:predicted regulator of Ras-like GTPase activity (Roadblock/LC7/MglB family)